MSQRLAIPLPPSRMVDPILGKCHSTEIGRALALASPRTFPRMVLVLFQSSDLIEVFKFMLVYINRLMKIMNTYQNCMPNEYVRKQFVPKKTYDMPSFDQIQNQITAFFTPNVQF